MLALDLDGQFSCETLPTRDGTLIVALETIYNNLACPRGLFVCCLSRGTCRWTPLPGILSRPSTGICPSTWIGLPRFRTPLSRRAPYNSLIRSTTDDDDVIFVEQLLTMMTNSISYLTQRTDFKQVDPEVPLTKSRPKDKVDPPKVFGG